MATGATTLLDDTLADIFRALPVRSLVVARCVCTEWRDIVDARTLLLPHLLPRSVRGVFLNYVDHCRPHHFSRHCVSSTIPMVDGMLSFLPNGWWSVMDHCNGLLLCGIDCESELCVCNPATSRWTLLPQPQGPEEPLLIHHCPYIAFDPEESPHFQVILIPALPNAPTHKDRRKKKEDLVCSMEWPPTPWMLHVFSSRSGHWEERAFVGKGTPTGTVEKMRLDPEELTLFGRRKIYAIYHCGSLYVHCRGSFITRFSLSNSEYQIIETPNNVGHGKPYLGKLHKDVCFGIVDNDHDQLKIWMLNESCGPCGHEMEWLLKYEVEVLAFYDTGGWPDGSWIVTDTYDYESYEWDSDNDDTFNVNCLQDEEDYFAWILILLGSILLRKLSLCMTFCFKCLHII